MRAVVLVLLAIAAFAGTGTVAQAQEDVPWTVGTAANEFGADRDNYRYTVDPGSQLEDGLTVTNHGTTPLELTVYSADAFTTEQGRLDLVAKGAPSTGVGAWVHPAQDRVTVQAGQSTQVPFTVSVPDTATAGDRMGGIVTSLMQGDVERRVGIRIQLRVGGELKPGLSVEDLGVRYAGSPFGTGDATLTYTIRNSGNAIVAARQAASVSGPFGSWHADAGPVADSPQLLPGATWKVSVPVHGAVPAVELAGSVTLTPLLTDASGSVAPLPAVEGTAHSVAVPSLLLLLLGVAIVIAVVVLIIRRRRAA
ncbi:WxL protein peptidoglycan domain-containing protein [Amycolatopsis pithecellobii]|uniref:DUF916 domain-containing protein n=1 Tax=Amycolatopsis pithecellobii TaxID=664692 RepID=A0A6N7Z757_9PSEU|nr:DUF916 domain-containing protein [Amycolatopsis pithecellobii]MTD57949.1 DUF916 domain-containing protein [Amycolatopsis pithecellobii]